MVNEVEMVEDGYVMLRSKRRLITTTRLLQQLVCPAPSSILSADASSFHDSVIYFILRASLGDTCSLMCGQRNDFHVSTLDNRNVYVSFPYLLLATVYILIFPIVKVGVEHHVITLRLYK